MRPTGQPVAVEVPGLVAGAVPGRGRADEDAGAAAAQRVGGDTGLLEHLPRRLQQQPLLRIHRQGLARRDAEEDRVEVGGAVDEPAGAGGRAARRLGVGGKQPVEVPVPVGAELLDAVAALRDQVPQPVGVADTAREAAAHADDHDRVVGDRPDRRPVGDGLDLVQAKLGGQVPGQRGRVGVVEDQGGGQGQAGGLGDPVTQVDGGDRVEAQVLEGAPGLHRVGGVAEHGGGMRPDQVGEVPVLLGTGQGEQLPPQLTGVVGGLLVGRSAAQRLPGLGDVVEQWARPGGRVRRGEVRPVDVGDGQAGFAVLDGTAQGEQGRTGLHRVEPTAAEQSAGLLGGGHAALGPGAPGDRGGGQSPGPTLRGQCVEVRVRGPVRALTAAAPDRGDGGEQHERVQRPVAEQRVEVYRAGDLAGDDLVEDVQVGVEQRGELGDPGGVHHRAQRGDVVQPGDQVGDLLPVGHVAGHHADPYALCGQLVGQFPGAGGVRAAPAGEYQVLGAVGGEPAGHLRAERAGAAGDEHGAARLPAGDRPGGAGGGPGQPADEGAVRAYGELVLVARPGEHPQQRVGAGRVGPAGQVDQAAPLPGVFQADHPGQAPDGGLCGAADRFAGVGADRAPGQAPQRRGDGAVLKGLYETGGGGHPDRHGRGVGVGSLVDAEQRHHTGQRGVPVPGDQVGELLP
ncbi:hypothetical protein Prubr_62580 [Polymorphospora rubra]|uniref:Uncharacterized protein n=1 Tax=Polymorphospora rubra TaxID=338584 RepID=A0A810N7K0_9ACTN|nr:hypothetical protein Prubr_62580 [Polymorphospora rubra]